MVLFVVNCDQVKILNQYSRFGTIVLFSASVMLNDVRNSSVLLQRATQLTLRAYILKPNGILWIRDSVILSPLAPSLLLFHVCLQKDLIGQSLTPCILKTTSRSSCLQRLKSNPQYLQDWNAELMSKIIAVNIYASISAE